MKKILVINTKYRITGGEDSNIVDEIKFLKKYYQVDYLEFNNSKRIDIFDLFSFVTNSNIKANKRLRNHINTFKPDIVYVHNTWFKAGLGIFNILKKEELPILVKIHNFRYHCAKSFLLKKHVKKGEVCRACNLNSKTSTVLNKYFNDSLLKSLAVIWHTKKFINILKHEKLKIFTITDFHKEFLLNLGVDKKKINLYCNPIEIEKVRDIESKNDSEYIVYAGRLSEEKGVEELIASWREAGYSDLKLKIIGTGPLERKLINNYSDSNIVFTGYLDNETVLKEIKNSRAVVTATKMFEGQPRLLCEASSFGIPSIYPSFGGMDEFFPNDYIFSFKQYDYKDLTEKLKEINDNEKIKFQGSSVHRFISQKLNELKLIKDFEEATKE